MSSVVRKLGVACVSVLLAVLVVEGVLSLALSRSLAQLGQPAWYEGLGEEPLERPRRAQARAQGPYRVNEDPWVGYTLVPESELEFFEQTVRTDARGLRERVGRAREPGDFHLVLVGDSVAYGHGLLPGEALGPRLEARLEERRVAGEPALAVTTVALPGWNHWNSTRFLLDHLDELAPDLVLFLPVLNDLEDAHGVDEVGQRRQRADPTSATPLASVTAPWTLFRESARRAHGRAALQLFGQEYQGQFRLKSGLSPSSRARVADMVENLARVQARLARRGAPLVLAPFEQDDLARHVRAGLFERGVVLPAVAMLDRLSAADGQGKDPHPSAETTEAMALFLAADLCRQALVPRAAPGPWPPVPERLRERAGVSLRDEELLAWRDEFQRREAAELSALIEPASVSGLSQIYGGVRSDTSLAPEAVFLLPGGAALELELEACLDEPGLYPLDFELRVDGTVRGVLRLEHATDRRVARVELEPAEAARSFELGVRAADWGLAEVATRRETVAARFLRAETLR